MCWKYCILLACFFTWFPLFLFPCVLRQILMYPRLVLSLVYSKDGFELLILLSPTADVGITGVCVPLA